MKRKSLDHTKAFKTEGNLQQSFSKRFEIREVFWIEEINKCYIISEKIAKHYKTEEPIAN